MGFSIVPPVTLTQEQTRLLGCLVEKARTTPAQYPLTANSLMLAANQTTSRHPIVEYDVGLVERTMDGLKAEGLVRFVFSPSNRATKFRHVLDDAWSIDSDEEAILCVLMLRGAQTVSELKTRTERMARFADLAAVEAVLQRLAARDEPMVELLDRSTGQKEPRWHQLLGDEPPPLESGRSAVVARASANDERISALEEQVARLTAQVHELRTELGLDGGDGGGSDGQG